jgi:hypothetical protein
MTAASWVSRCSKSAAGQVASRRSRPAVREQVITQVAHVDHLDDAWTLRAL